METIDTSAVSVADKQKMILERAIKELGATQADALKLTPKGQQIVAVARHVARRLYGESGDKTWLKAGRRIASSFSDKAKPAPTVETK